MSARRWIVAQVGAREHYAAARALHGRGRLARLVTDAYGPPCGVLLRRGPAPLRALAMRAADDLPRELVTSFTARTVLRRLRAGLRPAVGLERVYEGFLRDGAAFGALVARELERCAPVPGRDALFIYNTGALEPLRLLARRGVDTVLAQIDPGQVEEELVEEERARWPGWERASGRVPAAYFERMRAEWDVAGRVLVNSEWSRRALVSQGVDARKLVVVPLALEVSRRPLPRPVRRGTLRVLWLGLVCLRKGIPYLVEAARRLADRDLVITVAGPLHIDVAAARAPANLRFIGRVTREEAAALYGEADVFVLPTISDGFGITQLEAMAQGVPVVATPSCGQVVAHGVDGLLVPARDADALALAIASLDDDREHLAAMSIAAVAKAPAFDLERFADGVEGAIDGEARAS